MTAIRERQTQVGAPAAAAGESGWVEALVRGATLAGEEIGTALELARNHGMRLPLPGGGDTATRLAVLSALGRANLTVARVFEAHTDALAILAEAGQRPPADARTAYGVFAAEGAGEPLRATPDGDRFRLDGTKHWCSLGSLLDAALITAHVADGRRLFRVDLRHPSIDGEPTSGWVARGLRTVTSTSLHFHSTPAEAIGDVDWYLQRSGFSWGAVGVAACWHGGAVGLQQSMMAYARLPLDPLTACALGRVDAQLHAAAAVLEQAATAIDGGALSAAQTEVLALRVRAVVAEAAERTLHDAGHALGPAPLAFDEEHARRVADLTLYVRQHHAERDLAALGRAAHSAA